ncbi:MAG: hypothetical protein U0X91_21445 [Spirosomataceae bacterium]
MKKLLTYLTVFCQLTALFSCRSTDVSPKEIVVADSYKKARMAAATSVYINEVTMSPASGNINPFSRVYVKFIVPDASNVNSYDLQAKTSSSPTWTTLATTLFSTLLLPNPAPNLPNAKYHLLGYTDLSHSLFVNAPQVQFRVRAKDASGTVIAVSAPVGERKASLIASNGSPSLLSNPQLMHFHTRESASRPQIVLDWSMLKIAYGNIGFPSPTFQIMQGTGTNAKLLYDPATGWNSASDYRLVSNALGQNTIVIKEMSNGATLTAGSSHTFYIVAKPFATYQYSLTSPPFTTIVPLNYPGCQMRQNTLTNPVVSYSKEKIDSNSMWAFLNWGEAQAGLYGTVSGTTWRVEYKPVGTTAWQFWAMTGQSFLPAKVFTPGNYDVRVIPAASSNTYNTVCVFTMNL